MANTQKYLNHLLQNVGITPACSEEERLAAEELSHIFSRHGFEPEVQEFTSSSSPKLVRAILCLLLFITTVLMGVGGALGVIAALLAIACGVLYLLERFGKISFPQIGAGGLSQNVIAYHKAAGPLASPRNRPVVVVAHYDSPRADFLSQMPFSAYRPILVKLLPLAMIVPAAVVILRVFPLPDALKTVLWIVAILVALIPLASAVAILCNRYVLPYTSGSVCNKSSVAALLGIMDSVSPYRGSNEFPDDVPFDEFMAEQSSMYAMPAAAPADESPYEGGMVTEPEGAYEEAPADFVRPETVDVPDVQPVRETVVDPAGETVQMPAIDPVPEQSEPDAPAAPAFEVVDGEIAAPEPERGDEPGESEEGVDDVETEDAAEDRLPVNAAGCIRYGVEALRSLGMVAETCVIEYEQGALPMPKPKAVLNLNRTVKPAAAPEPAHTDQPLAEAVPVVVAEQPAETGQDGETRSEEPAVQEAAQQSFEAAQTAPVPMDDEEPIDVPVVAEESEQMPASPDVADQMEDPFAYNGYMGEDPQELTDRADISDGDSYPVFDGEDFTASGYVEEDEFEEIDPEYLDEYAIDELEEPVAAAYEIEAEDGTFVPAEAEPRFDDQDDDDLTDFDGQESMVAEFEQIDGGETDSFDSRDSDQADDSTSSSDDDEFDADSTVQMRTLDVDGQPVSVIDADYGDAPYEDGSDDGDTDLPSEPVQVDEDDRSPEDDGDVEEGDADAEQPAGEYEADDDEGDLVAVDEFGEPIEQADLGDSSSDGSSDGDVAQVYAAPRAEDSAKMDGALIDEFESDVNSVDELEASDPFNAGVDEDVATDEPVDFGGDPDGDFDMGQMDPDEIWNFEGIDDDNGMGVMEAIYEEIADDEPGEESEPVAMDSTTEFTAPDELDQTVSYDAVADDEPEEAAEPLEAETVRPDQTTQFDADTKEPVDGFTSDSLTLFKSVLENTVEDDAEPDSVVPTEPVAATETPESREDDEPAQELEAKADSKPQQVPSEQPMSGSTQLFDVTELIDDAPAAPAKPVETVDSLMAEIGQKPVHHQRDIKVPDITGSSVAGAAPVRRAPVRRSALLDLPDPSSGDSDPFANIGSADSGKAVMGSTAQFTVIGSDDRAARKSSAKGTFETIKASEPKPKPKKKRRGLFGRKKHEESLNDWLDNDGWKGGATGDAMMTESDLREAVASLGDDELLGHDIWFVATGASEHGNAGIREFLDSHRDKLRGVFLINLESIGTGQLAMLATEGERRVLKGDKRIMGLVSRVSADFHHEIGSVDMPFVDTDAHAAMERSLRSLTIAGVDGSGFACSHSQEDTPLSVDTSNIALVADVVTEVIRRS